MNDGTWVLPIIVVVIGFVVVRAVWRRRQAFVYWITTIVVVVYFAAIALVAGIYFAGLPPVGLVAAAAVCAIGAALCMIRPRSRYIPRAVKRAAIRKYERLPWRRYNPRRHDLGHNVAHSRGGSNTADNLRVEDKADNRRRGARVSFWDLFR
jgi:hypothetical protein